MIPLQKTIAVTAGKIAKNDTPYLFLGTNAIGPFFRNWLIPKQHEHKVNKKILVNWKLLVSLQSCLSKLRIAIPQLSFWQSTNPLSDRGIPERQLIQMSTKHWSRDTRKGSEMKYFYRLLIWKVYNVLYVYVKVRGFINHKLKVRGHSTTTWTEFCHLLVPSSPW